jgi:hypothetical protein
MKKIILKESIMEIDGIIVYRYSIKEQRNIRQKLKEERVFLKWWIRIGHLGQKKEWIPYLRKRVLVR